ncbi:MAG: glutaminase A [Hyphomonadaceae bacterium JAD_PAG50586_4]|nr:MAG: glutaminase A [Hyphomonadaceae bacterium JAD_PAG50586_4]
MASPIRAYLNDLLNDVRQIEGGEVATYIPELAKANPASLAIAITALDGKTYAVGDADLPFTIQSVSKPFLYGLALQEYGRETVLKHVGVEPTGDAFNSTVMDEVNNRPFNPMVNAGAIAVTALVKGESYAARRQSVLDLLSRFAGRKLKFDEAVFRSERDTGARNRVIASIMSQAEMISGDADQILDLYFSQCSVLVSVRDLAAMAATLANGGINPLTGQRALAAEYVHDVLTVMHSCGMYNYAGQWSYEVGIPAKSGVSGSIAAIVPGQIGISAYSPPLDRFGNSIRAIAACKRIVADFGLHAFRSAPQSSAAIRGEASALSVRSKRARTASEREVLAREGARIGLLEAQGALFFGAAERLVRRIDEVLPQVDWLVVDMRRVYDIDLAACTMLARTYAASRKGALIFANARDPLREALSSMAAPNTLFADRDAALEYCENALIATDGAHTGASRLSLKSIDLFAGSSAGDLQALERLAKPFSFEAGQHLVREGEVGRLFFVIAQGAASVQLNLAGARTVRVATIGAGGCVGEMALLDGSPRSADVIADGRVIAYGFSIEEMMALSETHPRLLLTIFANLSRDFAERLRAANNEIRSLGN